MNTAITVADARAALYQIVNPGNPDDPQFLSWLNQARERLMLSGKWKGMLVTVTFPVADGFFTLPPNFLSVLGCTYGGFPVPTFSQYLTYQENGPGEINDTSAFPYQLIDLGDGFATTTDITLDDGEDAQNIIVYSQAADDGKTIRIFGEDADDRPIYDATGAFGIEVTLASPSVQPATPFKRITGVIKERTVDYVELRGSPSVSAEYTLSVYQPSETRISYRRYKTSQATQAIRCLCLRRFLPVYSETDWVVPGNLAALKFSMKALFLEDADDFENASQVMSRAIGFLNNEAKALRGGAQASLVVKLFGEGQPITNYVN